MAQMKRGLDYFSHNTESRADSRMRVLRREYGSCAVDVWYSLLERLYCVNGYYLVYNDKTRNDLLWDLEDNVRGVGSPEAEKIAEMISRFAQLGLLSEELLTKGVITSETIQEQFYMSTLKRRATEVDEDYWLLSVEHMKTLSEKSPILNHLLRAKEDTSSSLRTAKESSEGSCSVEMPQSKENQSKEKHSKAQQSEAPPAEAASPLRETVGSADLPCADKNDVFADKSCSDSNNKAEDSASVISQPKDTRNAIEIKEDLIAQYGENIVKHYEMKFFKWVQKTGAQNAELYPQIEKWLAADLGGQPPQGPPTAQKPSPLPMSQSSLDAADVMRDIIAKYTGEIVNN